MKESEEVAKQSSPLTGSSAPSATRSEARTAHGTQRARSAYRTDIEGLRGIAVLAVVAYHAGVPGFSGGFVGVDVFFVLSGYLITGLLVGEIESTGGVDVVRFFARRARRLLPASALVLASTLCAGVVLLSPLEQARLARSALATAAYVSNFWFMLEAGNYFAAGAESSPLLHTWSLAVEEQFYLVWPFLLLLAYRGARPRVRMLGVVACLAIVSFVGSVMLTKINQPWAFYASPARAWEFAAGGLAFLVPSSVLHGRVRIVRGLAWLGLLSTVVAVVGFSSRTAFPGSAALVPVLGTVVLLIAGTAPGNSRVSALLDAAPLQRLGQLSYSWYLWHWPVLVFAEIINPGISLGGRLVCAGVSLVVAAAAYHLVENPVRFNPILVRRPLTSLAMAVMITAVGATLAWSMERAAQTFGGTPQYRRFAAAVDDVPTLESEGCIPRVVEATPRECTEGSPGSAGTLVLFGDSHAAHWYPAVERIALDRGWKLVSFVKTACPAAQVAVFHPTLRREYVECEQWREAVVRRIAELHPMAVLVASSTVYVREPRSADGRKPISVDAWENGTTRTLQRLQSLADQVFLMRDTPRADFDVPACLARVAHQRWFAKPGSCFMDPASALDERVFAAEMDATRNLAGVSVIDLSHLFCDETACSPVRDGVVVYRDDNHLTATFARLASDSLSGHLLSSMESSNGARSAPL